MVRDGSGSVVTVGTFDGVHLGHRRLIEVACHDAARLLLKSVAVTFDRHPATIVRPEATPKLLTSLEHKVELLSETGIDEIVVLAFDEQRANESAEDFVAKTLVGELGAKEILVGSNFRFGHRQRGDVRLLEEMGPQFGFTGAGIELIADEATHTVVSSSLIRGLIENGVLDDAERLLGRRHELRGEPSASDGDTIELCVDASLVVPPPGDYDVLCGPLGGPLIPLFASIPARDEQSGTVKLILSSRTGLSMSEVKAVGGEQLRCCFVAGAPLGLGC